VTLKADVFWLRSFLYDYQPDRLAPLSSLDVLQALTFGSAEASGWPAREPLVRAAGRFQETPRMETCSPPG
jgi:hypothetical protein